MLLRFAELAVGALRRAEIDLTHERCAEPVVFEARHEERRHHPDERGVSTQLAQHQVQRTHRPLGHRVVTALEEGHQESVRVSSQRDWLWHILHCLVRLEDVGQAIELDAIFVEPEIIEDCQCFFLDPPERVHCLAIVVQKAAIVRLAGVLEFAVVSSVLRWVVERVNLDNLNTCTLQSLQLDTIFDFDIKLEVRIFLLYVPIEPRWIKELVAGNVRAQEDFLLISKLLDDLRASIWVGDILRDDIIARQRCNCLVYLFVA